MRKMKTISQVSLKEEALSLHFKYVLKANVPGRAESKERTHLQTAVQHLLKFIA